MATFTDREPWLHSAAAKIVEWIFAPNGVTVPTKYRIACGWPAGTRGESEKIGGQCWRAAQSADGHNEIFISPAIDEPADVLHILAHELLHAADDCEHGHKGPFALWARRIGLIGPMRSTRAGPELEQILEVIADECGDYPHAKVTRGVKRAKAYQLRVECTLCGMLVHSPKKHIKNMHQCMGCDATTESLVVDKARQPWPLWTMEN